MIKIKFWCARCGRKSKKKVDNVYEDVYNYVPLGWYVQNAEGAPFALCPNCAQLSWQDKLSALAEHHKGKVKS